MPQLCRAVRPAPCELGVERRLLEPGLVDRLGRRLARGHVEVVRAGLQAGAQDGHVEGRHDGVHEQLGALGRLGHGVGVGGVDEDRPSPCRCRPGRRRSGPGPRRSRPTTISVTAGLRPRFQVRTWPCMPAPTMRTFMYPSSRPRPSPAGAGPDDAGPNPIAGRLARQSSGAPRGGCTRGFCSDRPACGNAASVQASAGLRAAGVQPFSIAMTRAAGRAHGARVPAARRPRLRLHDRSGVDPCTETRHHPGHRRPRPRGRPARGQGAPR